MQKDSPGMISSSEIFQLLFSFKMCSTIELCFVLSASSANAVNGTIDSTMQSDSNNLIHFVFLFNFFIMDTLLWIMVVSKTTCFFVLKSFKNLDSMGNLQ